MWVRDRLDGLWRDEDFADWYPRDGRPGLLPAQVATVCVLQFLLGLSDRQAAEAVRCRIDFKYALCLELDDPGFHHSVPADFRERLAQDDRADRLLDLALARLEEAGLVRERTAQRTDSTHVLVAVRDLTRLELVTEAVRAALEEVARTASHLLTGLVDEDWGRRYGRPVRLGKNPTRPTTRILAAGDDAWRLLERLRRHGPGHRPGPQAEALQQIGVQNYHRDAAGRLRWRTADDGGLPLSSRPSTGSSPKPRPRSPCPPPTRPRDANGPGCASPLTSRRPATPTRSTPGAFPSPSPLTRPKPAWPTSRSREHATTWTRSARHGSPGTRTIPRSQIPPSVPGAGTLVRRCLLGVR